MTINHDEGRSTMNPANAVRDHVTQAVTKILDNEESAYWRLAGVAESTVMTHGTRQQFADALSGLSDPDDWDHSRSGYELAVGQAVRDELREMLDQENEGREDTLTYRILIDVLDLADNAQAAMLGENYLAESVDDLEWEDEAEEES